MDQQIRGGESSRVVGPLKMIHQQPSGPAAALFFIFDCTKREHGEERTKKGVGGELSRVVG